MAYPAPANAIGSWFVLSHSASLLIVSGRNILLLIGILKKNWIFCNMNCVVRHVSDPYVSIALTFELQMLAWLVLKFIWTFISC